MDIKIMENSKILKDLPEAVKETEKFTDLYYVFLGKRDKILETKDPKIVSDFNDKIHVFVNRLIENHGRDEVEKRKLFHVIADSSIENEQLPYLDFEGEDSIEKFIREL